MQVAVLGGGLQGCCVAMALAETGARVTLFDRNAMLLSKAAVANEGKIHLGYMYGGDPTLKTARIMMQGALSFAPFFGDHLGLSHRSFQLSQPAVYVAHRESQKSAAEIEAYLLAVHSLVREAAEGRRDAYFGIDLRTAIRRWSETELDQELSRAEASAAFSSPEVAIDPVALAGLIRSRIEQTPTIEVQLGHRIGAVGEGDGGLEIVSSAAGATHRRRFDQVVNTLWDGRLAIDATMGLRPGRPWIHRLKYGVSFRPPVRTPVRRSITIVLGPFGEVVSYGNGSVYLTWYPHCLKARSQAVQPPDWLSSPDEPHWSEIARGTFEALAAILPALGASRFEELEDLRVRGGPIVAWGQTDIDDPGSELHRRFEIGVTSVGRYHTIDPGKLTMAPFFAAECAERIGGGERRPFVARKPVTAGPAA